ncbi:FtsH protease activity modulator HflK [Aquabacterium sp.]|uniref:FtsH protease activity modulator HflK n=1 Tax=Aquabacterium sp. TaxID=1872578 RepID=UPI0024889AD3|nr:FtsH protease activity modulator HflK [Aquabacterium sp.]MDI1258796.1 FtsH protease activity modulator HflK [Aquabacterium sp.]
MNMQSLEPGQVPENPRQPALSVLAAAAQLSAGTGRRLGWLGLRALKLALPQSAGSQVVYNNGRNEGPPDLDELWRDFNRKLSGLFAGKGGGDSSNNNSSGGGLSPDGNNAGIGIGLIAGLVALIWLGSGFFIVQEGQQAVVMSFGRFSHTAEAGFQWRAPYPFQSHEIVNLTQLRSIDVGTNSVMQATGSRESSMLTRDENIVDIRFTVQYRLSDARQYLFENRSSDEAVAQAAESAVREIVGNSTMDSVLYEQRDAIAAELVKSIQAQVNKVNAGVIIANVNVQSVQAPEPVQAAFDDAFKAGADRERAKNEGQAYANDVIPKAQGTAARLREEAAAYSANVVAHAEGDAQRFKSVLTEYQKAPGVTRDRLYIDAMQQVYGNVTKVMVDSRSGSNLLYLPLDKIVQMSAASGNAPGATSTSTPATNGNAAVAETGSAAAAGGPPLATDPRSRDGLRSRDSR